MRHCLVQIVQVGWDRKIVNPFLSRRKNVLYEGFSEKEAIRIARGNIPSLLLRAYIHEQDLTLGVKSDLIIDCEDEMKRLDYSWDDMFGVYEPYRKMVLKRIASYLNLNN